MSVKVFVYGTLRIGDSRAGAGSFMGMLAEEAYINGMERGAEIAGEICLGCAEAIRAESSKLP